MKVSKEECDKLYDLFQKAADTPMIKFTSDPKEKDLAHLAWERVQKYYDELAEKYKIDVTRQCIKASTGEIVDIPK